MNKPKISVIVPIYNSEKYLDKCIQSILSQTYSNLEIILIDDGSNDSSGDISERYALQDERVIVHHKANGGIGSAYKLALKLASGDYISFVDSDDYIDKQMYQKLSEVVVLENPDLVQFGITRVNEKYEEILVQKPTSEVVEGRDNILLAYFTRVKTPSLACRLFRAELLKGIEIFEQNMGVDETTIVQILDKCNKTICIETPLYYCCQHIGSVSRRTINRKILRECISLHRFICDFFEKSNGNYEIHAAIKYIKYLLYAVSESNLNEEIKASPELVNAICDFRKYYIRVKNTKELKREGRLLRLGLWIFNISPEAYILIRNLYK